MRLIKITTFIIINLIIFVSTYAATDMYNNFYFNGGDELLQKEIIMKPGKIELDAPSWIAINYHTGDIVSEKNMDIKRAPASLTKIMTSYIVANEIKTNNLNWDTMVTISEKAASTGGSKMYIKAGSKISVKDLVTGMNIISGNDAAIALAEHISGTTYEFTRLMNEVAKSIGMNNTHFNNPDGLPGGEQYTTAHDMALLARSYIYNFPEAYKIYREKGLIWNATKQKSVNILNRKQCLPKFNHTNGNVIKSYTKIKEFDEKNIEKCNKLFPRGNNFVLQNNRNKLLFTFDYVDGMKTGYTNDAGYCLVLSALKNNKRFIFVILGATNIIKRDLEATKLLRYALNKYENVLLYKANTPITIDASILPNVKSGEKITLISNKNIYKTIPKNYIPHIKKGIEFNLNSSEPPKKGQVVGNLIITLANTKDKIASIPVIAVNDVPQKKWW